MTNDKPADEADALCACMTVKQYTTKDGCIEGVRDAWKCVDCGRAFVPEWQLSYVSKTLRAELESVKAENERLREFIADHCSHAPDCRDNSLRYGPDAECNCGLDEILA